MSDVVFRHLFVLVHVVCIVKFLYGSALATVTFGVVIG